MKNLRQRKLNMFMLLGGGIIAVGLGIYLAVQPKGEESPSGYALTDGFLSEGPSVLDEVALPDMAFDFNLSPLPPMDIPNLDVSLGLPTEIFGNLSVDFRSDQNSSSDSHFPEGNPYGI